MNRLSLAVLGVSLAVALGGCDAMFFEPATPGARLEVEWKTDHGAGAAITQTAAANQVRIRLLRAETALIDTTVSLLDEGENTVVIIVPLSERNDGLQLQVDLRSGGRVVAQGSAVVSLAPRAVTTTSVSVLPVSQEPLGAAISMSAGIHHSCVATRSGPAYCWGDNEFAQVGGGGEFVAEPRVVAGQTFAQIQAGWRTSCGQTAGGQLYCWGDNEFGQFGNGAKVSSASPTLAAGGMTFASFSLGIAHACGLTAGGQLYCWGNNEQGQLGDGTLDERLNPNLVPGATVFRQVSARGMHSCALAADDSAFCWGHNEFGQTGFGSTERRVRQPTRVSGPGRFASISTGGLHTCGLASDGRAFCWGFNELGQVGDGTTTNRTEPAPVGGELRFAMVSAGGGHSCAIDTAGAAFCWGSNQSGAVGNGSRTDVLSPTPVFGGLTLLAISSGMHHTCAISTAETVSCWGFNRYGQVGDGSTANRTQPTAVWQ
jgi:alpha-tubulin suppressor-like RCC1 family protein